jgi:hypothetical protein
VSPQDAGPGRKIFGDAERGAEHDTDEFAHTEAKRD